ncbi:MAG: hypothetical protein ACU84J_12755 [Gammaproteobacteria bacterium]
MAGTAFIEDAVLFSPNMPEPVNNLLQAAVVASRNDKPRAEQLFQEAFQLDSGCLQTYFALYKFYFYQARLEEAETYVLAGLQEAAKQGGFAAEYRLLLESKRNMYDGEIALFYLYTLKALAFIKLRQQQPAVAHEVLDAIKQLDPEDRSGASVIMDLALALAEE